MQGMSASRKTVKPRGATAAYHRAKFAVFQDMYRSQVKRRAAMARF
jgi:hypothetical protein